MGETAAITYNANAGTPGAILEQAQENYARLAKENDALKKTIALINRAYGEDKGVLKVLEFLAASKPDNVKLLKLEVSGGVISIEGYSPYPGAFHDYIENLKARKDLFCEPKLEKISSLAPACKMGVIKAILSKTNKS